MSDFTDKLRDKWEGITPRERRLVAVLGIAVPIVLTVFLGMKISDGLDAREARVKRMRKALDTMVFLRQQPAAAKPAGDAALAEITTTPIILETYVAKAAEKLSIPKPTVNPGGNQTRDGFTTHVVRFDLRDLTIDQLKDFLEELETGSKRVVVTALTINTKLRSDETTKDKLDVKFELTTYSRPAGTGSGSAGSGST